MIAACESTTTVAQINHVFDALAANERAAVTESRTGAVADRSGAVHASGCRHCGPETVPRLQPPLINPCMHFSRTRLSEILHRVALGAAVYHATVPTSSYTPSFSKCARS